MTNKPELKPCPFCGGEAEFYPNDIEGEENWVECCNAKCQATNGYVRRTPEEALSAWNTRSEPAAPSLDEVEREICSMRKTIAVAGKHPDFVVRIDILKSILDARDNSNFLEKAMWSALAFLIADDFKAAKNTLDDALVKINLSHKGE